MTTIDAIHAATKETAEAAQLSCRVVTSFEEIAAMREEWDEFVEAIGGDIYMTFDWCRVWWQHYGTNRELQIFLFREGQRLVAVLPVFLERMWLGPVWLRVAKLVGADFALTLCNPPVHADHAKAVFSSLLETLIGQFKCDVVSFGPLSGEYQPITALRQVCCGRPDLFRGRESLIGSHSTFAVPETIDAYLSVLSKKSRGQLKRAMRRLESDHHTCLSTIRDPAEAEREFERFQRLHAAQWQAQGKLGHFGDWPKSAEFNLDLIRALGAGGRLLILRLTADGDPIAYQYGFVFAGRYYWRLPARAVGSHWDEYGLGNMGICHEMSFAIDARLRVIEAGIGHYDYKLQWGGQEHPLRSVLVIANRLGARLRASLFLRCADLLHLMYYRLWFLRLAAKLPFRRRPLWTTWIKSRL